MTKTILLDSTPVGLITNPKSTPLSIECQQWFYSLILKKVLALSASFNPISKLLYRTAETLALSPQNNQINTTSLSYKLSWRTIDQDSEFTTM